MVHVVHRSIQVYQDFHRQTLSHLQQLEQDCYRLMPQFELEQIFGMVERAHYMKAGAKYLHLTGFEKLAHLAKGRYIALAGHTLTFERDLLKQLVQMQEVFRLCLLSNLSTWQADLSNVATKLPEIFQTLDQSLQVHPSFQDSLPSREELELDIQRLLVAIVLIPELARLDMMLKNTPASKLSEILTSQLPRLETIAEQLTLAELQRSMEQSLHDIQARPSQAKTIGLQALLRWSDLCYKTLTQESSVPILLGEQPSALSSSEYFYGMTLERSLTDISVALIAREEEDLSSFLSHKAHEILELAQTQRLPNLEQISQCVLDALRYHPDSVNLIGRLSIQNWLRRQIEGIYRLRQGEELTTSESLLPIVCDTLLDLSTRPQVWIEEDQPPEPMLVNVLPSSALTSQLPSSGQDSRGQPVNGFEVSSEQINRLGYSLRACQQDIEQLPQLPRGLEQHFQELLQAYYGLVTCSLSDLFSRFQPMVETLARQNGKDITFKIFGGDIAIDRSRGDVVYELLLPLISNAIVHGIEQHHERESLGKPNRGKITLSAFAQGQDIQLELQDDGKGLSFEVLREWVINHYDLTHQEGNFLTEQEILDYVFRRSVPAKPFSGASTMLGLGAVKNFLDQLQGSIEVSSLNTLGTTFRIHLPRLILPLPAFQPQIQHSMPSSPEVLAVDEGLTIASSSPLVQSKSLDFSLEALRHQGEGGLQLELSTQGLFIWADEMSVFIIECDRIEEYVMPYVTEAHLDSTELHWRDQVIPIFSLHDFLGHSPEQASNAQENVMLVVKGEQQFITLRAPMEHLISDPTLQVNPLSQALAAPRYIYGTTDWTEDDTQPVAPRLVIDVSALIAQQPLSGLIPLSPPEPQALSPQREKAPSQISIMVVDDSRTAREIVSMTLRQGGYEVIPAKDGLDALEQLERLRAQNRLVDLIISDVAMPRMNGLEFLRRCRRDEFLKQIPIAMLSNCDSTTHSELAMKEGANAYLTKPYEESHFLAEIANLLATQTPIGS